MRPLRPGKELIPIHPGEELMEHAVRDAEDSGEMDALKGMPLDLSDDPDWLIMRVLK